MALIALVTTTQSTRNQHHFFIQPHPLTLVVLMSTLIQQSWTKKEEYRNSLKNSQDIDNRIFNSEESIRNKYSETHMTSQNYLNSDLEESIDKGVVNKVTNFKDVDSKENYKNRLEENLSVYDKMDKNIFQKNDQIINNDFITNMDNPLEINSVETNSEEMENKNNFKNRLKENINIDDKIETSFTKAQINKNDFIKEQATVDSKISEEPSKIKPAKAKSRQKRVLWLTEDGRLALPPGTTMVITPSLSMPFVRYPPEGFFSNITVSLPFTIDFDKLGLTDNENPYGVLPPVLARSMGRAAGTILADYIGNVFEHRRGKRSPETRPPVPPSSKTGHFHGGERALLYVAVEELLDNFGLDGKACLLRAICEVHAHSMKGFGLTGEMLRLFLSASKSPYSDIMKEYVEAEKAGKGGAEGHGECWPYMKDCPKSLFLTKHNKYSGDLEENEILDEDFLNKEVTYDPSVRNM